MILAEYGIYAFLNSVDEVNVYTNDGPGSISVASEMQQATIDELSTHTQLAREQAISEAEREVSASRGAVNTSISPVR